MDSIVEMFSYSFMVNAFVVGIFISICASLIGITLVLKRNSMIGDGLSHVGFGAFAIATVLNCTPLSFALPIVILTSILILRLKDDGQIHGDCAIAILSASSLAIGTFVISVTKGVNTDINNYLFGSILSINKNDLIMSVILSIIIILLYIFCYNQIFALTFDETFAKSIGINTDLYNAIFACLCSIVVVLGMRLMGSLLISSLIIFPTVSAMQVSKTFKRVVILAVFLSIINFTLGLIFSYLLSTPTGATIVIFNLITLIILKVMQFIKK